MEQELLDQDGKTIDTSKPKPNWGKRLLLLGGVLVLVLVLFIALLPTILSSGPGTRFVMGIVNDVIPGDMQVDDLSLGWFSGTSAKGIRLNDPDGKPVVTVASAEMPNTTVLTLVQSNLTGIEMTIDQPVFTISTETPGGPTNMERALFDDTAAPPVEEAPKPAPAPDDKPVEIRWPEGITFKVSILQGSFSFSSPDLETVSATVPSITVDALDPANITAAFNADIKQGSQSGQFSLDALAKGLFDANGLLVTGGAEFDVNANAENLPMVVVDQLAALRGKAQAMIGPMLNAKLNVKGKMSDLNVAMNAKAEHLNIDGSVAVKPQGVEASTAPQIKWTLTPQAHALLETQTTLNKSVDFEITLPKLELPSEQPGSFDFAKMAAELNMTISEIELAVEKIGTLTVSNTSFKAMTDELAKKAEITANADVVVQGQQPGQIKLNVVGHELFDSEGKFAQEQATANFEVIVDNVATALADQVAGMGTTISDALGAIVNLNVNGELKQLHKNGVGETQLDITSSMLQMKTTATISEDAITLAQGKLLTYQLTPQALAGFLPKNEQGQASMGLARPSRVEAFVDKFEMPRNGMGVNLKMTEVGLRATVDQLQMTGLDKLDRLSVKDVDLSVPASSLATPIAAVLKAALQDNDAPAGAIKLEASAFVPGVADNAPEMPLERVSLRITSVATSLIKALANQEGEELSLVFGSALDLIEVQVSPESPAGNETQRFQIATTLTDQDPLLDAKVSSILGIEPDAYSFMLANPSSISMRLQPTMFNAYMASLAKTKGQAPGDGKWTLVNTPQVALNLETMAARVPKDMSGNMLQKISAAIDAATTVDQIIVQSPTGPRVYVDAFKLAVESRELTRQTRINLTGRAGKADDATSDPVYANLMSETTISDYMSSEGEFDRGTLSMQTDTRLPNIPIDLLEQFAGQTKLRPIFGNAASVTINSTMPGNTTVTMDSENAKLNADVAITGLPVRTLTLNKDITASVTITQELATTYLEDVHPMFHDVLGAKEPTTFTLYKVHPETQQETVIPLSAFDINNVSASGQLAVTPLKMNRRGWMTSMFEGIFDGFAGGITKVLSLAGGGGKQVSDKSMVFGERQSYTADFPLPLRFNLKDGVVETKKFWLSSDDLAIGFEGKTNLDSKMQDFVIGIPGATLLADNPTLFVPLPTSSIFRTAISADTVYNIGIKGPTDGDITTQVNYGALVTQVLQSAAELNARRIGGDAGAGLVGGLTKLAGGIGQAVGDQVDPAEKQSALRNVDWKKELPESVEAFMAREADKRKMLMLEENKPAGDGEGENQQDEQPKPGGGLLDGLLGR